MSPRPRFVLVRRPPDEDRHALPPEEKEGAQALCGEQRPDGAGWVVDGFTSLVYRITCHSCRARALAIVADWPASGPTSTAVTA
jgi:hypothetical protein